jgi:hypothetical protein
MAILPTKNWNETLHNMRVIRMGFSCIKGGGFLRCPPLDEVKIELTQGGVPVTPRRRGLMLAPLTKKKHRNVENQQTLVQWLQTSASFCHLSHLPQRCVVLCIPRIPFPACLSLSMWHSAEYMLEYAWPILTSCICQRAAVSPFHMACYMLAWTGVGNPGALRGLWPTEAERVRNLTRWPDLTTDFSTCKQHGATFVGRSSVRKAVVGTMRMSKDSLRILECPYTCPQKN